MGECIGVEVWRVMTVMTPMSRVPTMIWILSEELATNSFGHLCHASAFNRTIRGMLLSLHQDIHSDYNASGLR
jgi:hypothetical protein